MKIAFVLSVVTLLWAQVLALMLEQVPQHLKLVKQTPLLEQASVSPVMLAGLVALLFMLFVARLRREPGPLAAGAFLTGLGYVGLQILALEWLRPHVENPLQYCVGAFALASMVGSWRALSRRNEDDSLALIAYFISVVAAIAFGYFVIGHFDELNAPANILLAGGVFLAALPAYFSARASATQIFLIQPGGFVATLKILTLHVFGGVFGGVVVLGLIAGFGVAHATFFVAAVYLLAAWLYTQGSTYASALIGSPG